MSDVSATPAAASRAVERRQHVAAVVEARPVHILLVDDDPIEAVRTVQALRESKISNEVSAVATEWEALAFVRGAAGYPGAKRTDLIVLSSSTSVRRWHGLLGTLGTDPDLSGIPIVVLTDSPSKIGRLWSTNRQVRAYLTRPLDPYHFINLLTCIDGFALNVEVPQTHCTSVGTGAQ